MKYFKILAIVLLSSVISFYACNEKADALKDEARKSIEVSDSANPADAATPTTPEPAQNAAGVWHYTCEKGCAGGAGAAGNCATCGGPLAHNTAYHAANATSTPNITPVAAPANPPTQEPAQNAAGVWHYTCANGCAGGGAAAGPCGTCGGTLAHNSAYHN